MSDDRFFPDSMVFNPAPKDATDRWNGVSLEDWFYKSLEFGKQDHPSVAKMRAFNPGAYERAEKRWREKA